MTLNTKSDNSQKPQSTLPLQESTTLDAATAWLYALAFEPDQEMSLLQPMLIELFPNIDFSEVQDIVQKTGKYALISTKLTEEVLKSNLGEKYEDFLLRRAALTVFITDMFTNLSHPATIYATDIACRIRKFTDETTYGGTKNAAQVICGIRTRVLKVAKRLVITMLYMLNIRKDCNTFDELFQNIVDVIRHDGETTLFYENFDTENIEQVGEDFPCTLIYAIEIAKSMVENIFRKKQELEKIIEDSAIWRFDRILPLDLAIIEYGVYGILFKKEDPTRVMNDTLDYTEKYSTKQSKGFVRKILTKICQDHGISI